MKAKITSKYQIVLPKEIREYLKVHPGDQVDFIIKNGTVEIRPLKYTIKELEGIGKDYKLKKPVTIEEMDEEIAKAIEEEFKGEARY